MNKTQCSAILEAVDPFKMAQTSMSYTYKVIRNLHMLWMCIWMSPYHTTIALIVKTFGIQNSGCLLRSKPQSEAQQVPSLRTDPFKMGPTSISNTYKVNYNLYMLWMCPYHTTTALIVITFRSYLEFCLSSDEQTTIVPSLRL